MKKLQYPQCPYCGKKVNPLLAFTLKNEGEYRCTKCSGVSNIELNPTVYKMAVGMVLAAAVVFVVEELLVRQFVWYSALLVLLPFLIFYILSSLFLELKRPVIKRKRMERRGSNSVTGGITGGINDGLYGAPGRRMDEPTAYVPSTFGQSIIQPQTGSIPLVEEPTIPMSSLYEDGNVPLRSLHQDDVSSEIGRFRLRKSVDQFEEDLGDRAQPVFYNRPKKNDLQGGDYRSYRAPLNDRQEGSRE